VEKNRKISHLSKVLRFSSAAAVGVISGWLSSRAYTKEAFYLEPVAIFVGFSTLLLLPYLRGKDWRKWIYVCFFGLLIYLLLINAWFLPFLTMPIGSLLFLVIFSVFMRTRRYLLVPLFASSQFVAGFVINFIPFSFRYDDEVAGNIFSFTFAGIQVFVWQVLTMAAIYVLITSRIVPQKSIDE
jgi:hypothetical protein